MAIVSTAPNQVPFNILSATGQSSVNAGGTTSIVGDWYRINPQLTRFSWQVIQTASSAGATAASTVFIEVSNDGITPLATKGQTISLTGTSNTVSDGATFISSMSGQWAYVRANLNSLTTSTAGTTGLGPTVNVIMNNGFGGLL